MDNTQLPAEVLEDIELKAEHEAALQFHPVYSPDQNTACRICYRNGAKEYATELIRARQENESLTNQLKNHSGVSIENMKLLRREYEALQAKCEKLEGERYETRLAMRMLLKAFKGAIKTERHKEWYAKAEAIFNKYHNMADVLRNKDLSAGVGDKEPVKQWWEAAELPKYVKHKHGWVDRHIGINHAGDCLVFIGRNDAIEWQFSFLQPATKEQYDAYINQKEDKQ